MTDIYASLVGKAGKEVTWRVSGIARTEGAHDEVVVPTADEQGLYYLKWIQGNIDRVNRAIDEIKAALARNPARIPQPPPYPDKHK